MAEDDTWDETAPKQSPRVLTLTFEFHIAQGLRSDVRAARIRAAADQFTVAVQALAATVFPWAERLVVTRDWSYRWMHGQQDIGLPATEQNGKRSE
jgi:hypothetical protein